MINDFGRQTDSGCLVLEGSAGEAACRGGERGGVMLPESIQLKGLARRSEGGGGYLWTTASSADLRFRCYLLLCLCVWGCAIVGLWGWKFVCVCGLQ